MNSKQKKELYGSIMKTVAKTVKQQLNENASQTKYGDQFIEALYEVLNNNFTGRNSITINLDNKIMRLNTNSLKDLAGYIVEGVIYYCIESLDFQLLLNSLISTNVFAPEFYKNGEHIQQNYDEENEEYYETAEPIPSEMLNSVKGTISSLYRRGDKKHYDFDFQLKDGTLYKIEIKSHFKNNSTKFTLKEQEIKDDLLIIDVQYDINNNSIVIKKIDVGYGDELTISEVGKETKTYQLSRKNSNFRKSINF